MEKTLKVINELEKKGLIQKYAIGGAFAAFFYSEPTLTYDLDVFIYLAPTKSPLVSRKKGYREDREHILIEGVPVQFIPTYNRLIEEAVKKAKTVKYGKVKTRALCPEHLAAIMVQTDRPKDRTRLALFIEEARINSKELKGIFERHGLKDKWKKLSKEFLKRS